MPSMAVSCFTSFIDKNEDWFVKPFESGCLAGGFVFSHGHFILNAGYSKEFDNIYQWEEPFLSYLAWKAGYTLYAPNQNIVYHL